MSRYGDVYVVTTSPGNVDKLDNGFRLHGGGGVYLAESTADIGSDPYMYWQVRQAGALIATFYWSHYLSSEDTILTTHDTISIRFRYHNTRPTSRTKCGPTTST